VAFVISPSAKKSTFWGWLSEEPWDLCQWCSQFIRHLLATLAGGWQMLGLCLPRTVVFICNLFVLQRRLDSKPINNKALWMASRYVQFIFVARFLNHSKNLQDNIWRNLQLHRLSFRLVKYYNYTLCNIYITCTVWIHKVSRLSLRCPEVFGSHQESVTGGDQVASSLFTNWNDYLFCEEVLYESKSP